MYAACVKQMVAIHETIATNRLQFAMHITQVCEELTTVHKDTDRSRKQLKDASERYERALRDSESALDKAKAKQEATSDAWDKARQALRTDLPRGAASPPTGPTGLSALFAKPPEKEEEAARHRAARANDAYQTQLAATLALRNEFQRSQLPSLVHGLKEVNDECDVALQFHLANYVRVPIYKQDTDGPDAQGTDLANVSWNPDDYASDIHTLASAIKLFLRSLPDSVLPRSLARQLLQAARMPDARVQLLTLHDLINGLPEPNYCTLRAVIQHLDRVALRAARNQMHVHNLSIVFGPTLMHGGAVAVAQTHETANEMHLQCRVVEVVLSNCRIIFEPDEA
ncbi:hypothetical protein AMAG_20595 [Allomyces macrogynus ATCC 38327]|uniref:Rho-GAP domain-containing protein n=1 Tax=Allomyces macrogynus (strain ATCC 38327) TaxID=578462 RepID=A0A0L0TD95_ALLM3|nr:hypothetical protein AMAG_20595 [Allomyces macrogynus ATCC 38327]|eukprot:KNE72878.1 hypothetical protein AMAG_20595 [Allomyces macrogynus ATCC 38327]